MNKSNISAEVLKKISRHPQYKQLLKKRSLIGNCFFVFTLIVYNAFILFLGFAPEAAGKPLFVGATLSIGIFLGVLICLLAIILVVLYVTVSNRVFDPLINNIVKDVL